MFTISDGDIFPGRRPGSTKAARRCSCIRASRCGHQHEALPGAHARHEVQQLKSTQLGHRLASDHFDRVLHCSVPAVDECDTALAGDRDFIAAGKYACPFFWWSLERRRYLTPDGRSVNIVVCYGLCWGGVPGGRLHWFKMENQRTLERPYSKPIEGHSLARVPGGLGLTRNVTVIGSRMPFCK